MCLTAPGAPKHASGRFYAPSRHLAPHLMVNVIMLLLLGVSCVCEPLFPEFVVGPGNYGDRGER